MSQLLSAHAEAATVITAARLGDNEGNNRIVFELTRETSSNIIMMHNPERLVVDFDNAQWKAPEKSVEGFKNSRIITKLRWGQFTPSVLRVVADLKMPLMVAGTFSLPPDAKTPYTRLVIDLAPAGIAPASGASSPPDVEKTPAAQAQEGSGIPVPFAKPRPESSVRALPTVVIDPGHGGDDPGTIGKSGSHEKFITLKYAHALRSALEATGRYRVVMTRKDDRYLRLRERVKLGRDAGGLLFISLHADSAPNAEARGASVYTLSEKASDEEAEFLATQENKADIIAGMDLGVENEDVAGILIELAQRDTKNKSSEFAEDLAEQLKKEVKLVNNSHRFAGFAVLKAPDVPSVLIELGFLSNPKDEVLLNSKDYQDRVIRSLTRAIDAFFTVRNAGNER